MAAIHGLIDRTDKLQKALDELEKEKLKNADLVILFKEQSEMVNSIRKELDDMKSEMSKYAVKGKKPKPSAEAYNLNR